MTGPGLLEAHLRARRLTAAEFARMSDGQIDESDISRWLAAKVRPGLDKAVLLEALSKGQVPAKSWAKTRRRRKAA